jgi:aspartyl/glutamyl-tRNA(Asn/Gln) amidotransferase C subunit
VEVKVPTKAKGKAEQAITVEIFKHLVDLAAFELPPEEGEYLRKELNGQLRAIRELEAIDVSEDIPITSHGVPYSVAIMPSLREDIIEICPEADDILDQAPQVEERYIVVPDIPSEALE